MRGLMFLRKSHLYIEMDTIFKMIESDKIYDKVTKVKVLNDL